MNRKIQEIRYRRAKMTMTGMKFIIRRVNVDQEKLCAAVSHIFVRK